MLKFENMKLLCDVIENESTIPDIKDPKASAFFVCDDSVDERQAKNIGKGMLHTILPYKIQNDYGRREALREFKAAVLENEYLKAVFLPELGGRLWSLYDKKYGRDLIYENGSVRIANLALCNAWFAGGVEWNIGMKGHSPFTCRPLFSKKCKGKRGNDILLMYEYEEIRGVVFSMEFTLCDAELLVHVNIKNTKNTDTYTYWWSNIAVKEEGTSVFVPADSTYVTSYRDGGYKISKTQVTEEMRYPRNTPQAKDYFYNIPDTCNKWIAAIDENGVGLLHTSTNMLLGRKTFLWGTGRGGEHWNSRLCDRGNYLEIQAGLAKTQFEHLPLRAYEEIMFTESYSLADIGRGHTYAETITALSDIAKSKKLCTPWFDIQEECALEVMGSSRGYLNELLRGERISNKLEFPKASLTDDFAYYYSLLSGSASKGSDKTAFVTDIGYKDAILKKGKLDEFDYYVLSLIDYANSNFKSSLCEINESLEICETAYALCAAALFAFHIEGDKEKAYVFAEKACRKNPKHIQTVFLYAEMSTAAEKYEAFIDFYNRACNEIKREGRVKMFVGKCYIALNKVDEAEKYINKELSLPDLREGEYSITNLWVEMYRKKIANRSGVLPEHISTDSVLQEYPIPYEIDFRMH